jgi:hypothetical protein
MAERTRRPGLPGGIISVPYPAEQRTGAALSRQEDINIERSSNIDRTKEKIMQQNIDTVRELNAAELDQVGGGLSLGVGLNLDLSQELGAVSGTIDQVGGLVGGTLDTVLGAVGGLLGGVLGK